MLCNTTVSEKIGSYLFSRKHLLGSGTFSNVYLGKHISNNHFLVAIKEIDIGKSNANYLDEIHIIRQISCPNIIKIYDFYYNNSHSKLYIILEYCNQGSISKQKKANIREIYNYFQQILQGMKALRSLNIIHRDLKLENILLRNNTVKISDFGLAKKLGKNPYFISQRCGTPSTMAPEVLLDPSPTVKYDYKCDIWALGVILFELVYGLHPFQGIRKGIFVKKKTGNSRKHILADDFIEKTLRIGARERVDWDEVFMHPINFLCSDEEFIEWKRGRKKGIGWFVVAICLALMLALILVGII